MSKMYIDGALRIPTCDDCGGTELIETNDGFSHFYRCAACGADWLWEDH